jgi:hypothetical protein
MRHNQYGVKGPSLASGMATLSTYFAALTFEYNVLAGGSPAVYPAFNYFPPVVEFEAAFINAAGGNFALVPETPFRIEASDGGALGADMLTITTAQTGAPIPQSTRPPGASTSTTNSPTGHVAVCRPGSLCPPVDPSSRRSRAN